MSEERYIKIESKVTEQELLIEELNQVIYSQQKQIDALESKVSTLLKRFKDFLDGAAEEIRGSEKPPHY